MRVAFYHRKLSPKWSIQGPLAGMGIPFKAALAVDARWSIFRRSGTRFSVRKCDHAKMLERNRRGAPPPPFRRQPIVVSVRFRLDVRVLDDLRVTIELDL